jgi:hypothetical protein
VKNQICFQIRRLRKVPDAEGGDREGDHAHRSPKLECKEFSSICPPWNPRVCLRLPQNLSNWPDKTPGCHDQNTVRLYVRTCTPGWSASAAPDSADVGTLWPANFPICNEPEQP